MVGSLDVIEESVETIANVGICIVDAPTAIVMVICESVELAIEVGVVFLAVTGDAGVERNTVGRTIVACESAEFPMWYPTFTAGCSRVVEVVVPAPAFDGLGVYTEFVCELANRVRPWQSGGTVYCW